MSQLGIEVVVVAPLVVPRPDSKANSQQPAQRYHRPYAASLGITGEPVALAALAFTPALGLGMPVWDTTSDELAVCS